jgi:hypothetical protein
VNSELKTSPERPAIKLPRDPRGMLLTEIAAELIRLHCDQFVGFPPGALATPEAFRARILELGRNRARFDALNSELKRREQ